MEKEVFLSGYCRCMDASRMVAVFINDDAVEEVDCCYGSCTHQPNCTIAREIDQLLQKE